MRLSDEPLDYAAFLSLEVVRCVAPQVSCSFWLLLS